MGDNNTYSHKLEQEPTGTMGNKKKKKRFAEDEEVKIRFKADVSDAIRTIKELERQANKLADIVEQGNKHQRGFLSPKQGKLIDKMLQEVERSYDTHYKKLESLKKDYARRKEEIEKDIIHRQQELDVAQGANEWGDVASDEVIAMKQKKLDEAKAKLSSLTDSKNHIRVMETATTLVTEQRNRAQNSHREAGELHEMTPARQQALNTATSIMGASGMVLSTEALLGYFYKGMGKLAQGQYASSDLGQKIVNTYQGEDERLRKDTLSIGKELGYSTLQSNFTLKELLKGGQTGTPKESFKDLQEAQQFGRAYSVNPLYMANAEASLKKVGAMQDGDMQRFANLIAGAISKTGMGGREEEQLRASMNLITQVTNKLGDVSSKQVNNVVGLQTQLGEALPSFRGDKGANLLGNIDAGIKNASNSTDILLGWGTKYAGISGREQLELMKEQGISNPENVKNVLSNVNKMIASPSGRDLAISQAFNLPINQVKMLKNSGLLDKMSKGQGLSDNDIQDIEKSGEKDLANQLRKYNTSDASTKRENAVSTEETQTNIDSPISHVWHGAKNLWNKQPTWLRGAELVAGGILGGKHAGRLIRSGGETLIRRFGARRNGTGGILEGLKGIFRRTPPPTGSAGVVDSAPIAREATESATRNIAEETAEGATRNIAQETAESATRNIAEETAESTTGSGIKGMLGKMGSKIGSGVRNLGENGISALGESGWRGSLNGGIKNIGKGLSNAGGKILPKVSKALPFGIGAVTSTALNKATTNDSWGKSATKGILGTILGGALIGLTTVATGGTALPFWAALGLGAGGGIAGDALVDHFWKNEDENTPNTVVSEDEQKQADELRKKVQDNVNNYYKNNQGSQYNVGDPSANISRYSDEGMRSYGTPELERLPNEPNQYKPPQYDNYNPTANTSYREPMNISTTQTSDTERSHIEELSVGTLKIDGNTIASALKKDNIFPDRKSIDSALQNADKQQHIVKVMVDGKIEGMNDSNQNKISTSISSYFSNLLGGLFSNSNNLDLSLDQRYR